MNTVDRMIGIALALAFSLNSALANTPAATTSSEPEEPVAAAVAAPPGEPATEAAAESDAAPVTKSPDESAAETATPTSTVTAPPTFGPGMQIPVDGTSLDAFEQSLAGIKDKTTTAEYTTLTNAIDYLMVYYIEARRDRTKLAALLNGMTGEQIVDRVKWRKRPGP